MVFWTVEVVVSDHTKVVRLFASESDANIYIASLKKGTRYSIGRRHTSFPERIKRTIALKRAIKLDYGTD